MALGDVFDDGQPQPGTAGLPGPSHIDATEAFEDTVERSSRDPRTGVGDRHSVEATCPEPAINVGRVV